MRRSLTTVVAMCLALGVNATPVHASMSQCSSGRFCEWNQINYSGGEFTSWATSENDWPLFGIENDDDSVWSREATRTLVYRGSDYSEGAAYCVGPGVSEDDINDTRDNDGDSNALASFTTSCAGYNLP